MDFSHNYFPGTQPYPFMGIPPLTPSHSNSAASDDFNTTSPPEVFDGLPNDHFPNFDTYAAQFNLQQGAFPGPPTPPTSHNIHANPPPTQPLASGPPTKSDIIPLSVGNAESHSPDDLAQGRRNGSNSDDDDMTPAQSRRKAQNRAAQRAFRERKERHVKDLEAKLATLEEAQRATATENERLKTDLQKVSTENEILRARSTGAHSSLSPEPTHTGPMQYKPADFFTDVLSNHPNKSLSHRIVTGSDGERLLSAGATWDFIIAHPAFKRGMVDVGHVSERLKHQAKCDGQGPVFSERSILDAIEQSVASGSDELL